MISANELYDTISDLCVALSALRSEIPQLKYHLTGGLASSYYGEPRFTQDIDIVMRLSQSIELERLIEVLSDRFIIDGPTVVEAVKYQSIFQALHQDSMIKIDFHVGEAIEKELDRSREVEILSGLTIPLVSKEDAILSKLLWISKGSEKSRHDVKSILKRHGDLDLEFVRAQSAKLGLTNILQVLRAEIEQSE